MTVPISVIVPVGPLPRHSENLAECIESVKAQSVQPEELLVIDNGYGVRADSTRVSIPNFDPSFMRLWPAPWAMGLATGFNVGISLAKCELCFMLGSDDLLMPHCIERCWDAWHRWEKRLGWYFVGVKDSSGLEQNTPCMAAMVSKELWTLSGGFELGSDYGCNSNNIPTSSCEIAFISKMILANGKLGATYRVSDDVLYFWRKHG